MPRSLILFVLLNFLIWAPAVGRSAEPLVRLELHADPGFPIDGHQRWITFLSGFGFAGLQIRNAKPNDEPSVTTRGSGASAQYKVVGILTDTSVLFLPGAKIRFGQRKELANWLSQLRDGGEEALFTSKGRFGLLPKQLTTLHEALKVKVTFSTRGKQTGQVVRRLTSVLPLPLELDSRARTLLAGTDVVLDELKGLSRGTALAVALRPIGLALVPTSLAHSKMVLRISSSASLEESWPIGFRPTGKSPGKIAPAAFKFLEVEIQETPLDTALQAVEARLKLPILLDRYQMAEKGIDAATSVSLPKTKTFYKKIIDRLLFQALLKSEFRVDEAGQPFLWVTTSRK